MLWYQNIFGNLPLNMSDKKLAKYETDMEFINTFNRLMNLALDTFVWEGLPETCNARFLELSLLLYGKAVLVNRDGAYMNLAFAAGSDLNIYGEPMNGYGYGVNGFNEQFKLYIDGAEQSKVVLEGIGQDGTKNYNAVMCRDNKLSFPYINYIFTAARRLTQTMRSADVIAQNLKQPIIITCEESMVKSVRETLNRRDDNVNSIISSGKLPIDSFKVWKTEADPNTLKVMWEHYGNLDSQVKELLGVNNNPNVDKKERLLVDEVNANNEATEDNISHRLKERELFCERVNKAFGLNISVSANVDKYVDNVENEETEVEEDVDL